MNQPLGFYLYSILVAGIILVLFFFGYLNQYKLYGRKSEYYCFVGTVPWAYLRLEASSEYF